jgi:hypothetical protein
MLRPAELDRRDIDLIRKEVFSANTFYVTSITQVCRFCNLQCLARGHTNNPCMHSVTPEFLSGFFVGSVQ